MSEDDIRSEIRSAFFEPMENDSSFPFTFLQTSGCGGKMLVAPSLSTSFNWNAQEVSKLGKTCFYILAGRRLSVEDVKVSMEWDMLPPLRNTHMTKATVDVGRVGHVTCA